MKHEYHEGVNRRNSTTLMKRSKAGREKLQRSSDERI